MTDWRIIVGDALASLASLPDGSVQSCVTSPPYFGLRDYGVDGQIGLEASPDEYVARLVAVFREVRRVLRDDGTLWLNLGDSYAGSWGAQSRTTLEASISAGQVAAHPKGQTRTGSIPAGAPFKAKDLLGIPWMVAFALRQPYYAGKIAAERDRAWLAAMIDGEGCIFIHRRPAGQHSGGGYMRQTDTYSPALSIAMTSEVVVRRCAEIAGAGSVGRRHDERRDRRPMFTWSVRATDARRVLAEVYPFLVGKRQEARLAHRCDGADDWEALKALHAGASTRDAPAPPSMLEPGWWLREEVIWSKLAPMLKPYYDDGRHHDLPRRLRGDPADARARRL
jgi:hypothetical protein